MHQTLHELAVVAGWLALTAIINALVGKHSPEEWERLAEENPRYAALARMLRAAGLDPVKLAEAFVDFVRGRSAKVLAEKPTSSVETPVPQPVADPVAAPDVEPPAVAVDVPSPKKDEAPAVLSIPLKKKPSRRSKKARG